jgi:mono/diheme cytochrome c family protein
MSLSLALAGCGGGGGGGGDSSVFEVRTQEAELPEVTWYSAAEPLLQRYCVTCHTDGGPAPFPLESYSQVYAKRSAMEYVLESQTMPPLGFADLTPAQEGLLLDWLAAGAPQGDDSQSPLKEIASGFTYHGDTRAIIEEYCVTCHIDGGVAPFPLDSYEKVKGVAAAAAFAVENGTMPPWPPTMGYSRFAHERVLPPEDEFALANWLAGDLAEGDPADYVPPVQIEGESEEINFNLKLPLPQPYTPKLRPDDHRCFAIDWPLDDFTYVTAVDVIPDQVAEVHHVIVNIIEPKDVGPYLAAGGQDGQAGWPCLLSGGLPGSPLPRQIGGWVPGAGNGAGPKGTGIGVDPDSIMVVQMHYNTLVAEPTPDQSIVLVATTDKVERPASGFLYTNPFWLSPGGMPIPAGEPEVRHSFEVPTGILASLFGAPAGVNGFNKWALHTGFLHMHNLGETGRVTLIRKNGTEQVVVDIRDWDFNWQSTYGLERELLVEPGDSVRLECSWDNSASNQTLVDGEQIPPRDVEWGDGTGDEMCLTNFLMTVPKEGYDYSYSASVHIETPAYRQRFAAGDLVPLELLFNNFSLHEPGAHGDEHGGDHAGVYEGHYHVYLDTDDDSAEHLTAWDAKYFYQLPEDLEPGQHTLRVSLRGTDHHALGIEQSVVIDVEENTAAAPLQLIDVNDWAVQAAADDSHASHRPAAVECPDNSWYNEDGALEVETGFCNYLSVSQGSKAALGQGDNLHLVLWHGNLAFEQKATAHVAITIAGKTVWQEEVEIPTDANIYDLRIPIDFDAPAGSKVEFHVHNHGYNTWTLLQLELER